jgi:hypothetical protein
VRGEAADMRTQQNFKKNCRIMDNKIHVFALLLVLNLLQISATGKIIYVDVDSTGASDGSSWPDAHNRLQDALANASCSDKPVEIRVVVLPLKIGPCLMRGFRKIL